MKRSWLIVALTAAVLARASFGQSSGPITDRGVFDQMSADIVALAKWRAERRERCKYVIDQGWDYGGGYGEAARSVAVPEGGVRLLLKCPKGSESLTAKRPNFLRELESAQRISASQLPETKDLLPLFRDLSISAPLEPSPGGRPLPYLRLEPSNTLPLVSALHRWPIPLDQLLEVLAILEPFAPKQPFESYGTATEWLRVSQTLDAVAVHDNDPRAGQALVRWTEYAINAGGREDERATFVRHELRLLSTMGPQGQAPLDPIASLLSARMPRSSYLGTDVWRAKRLNASLRDPTQAWLVEFINDPEFRYLVPDLVAKGAPANGMDQQLPLSRAIQVASELVPLLVEHGADPNLSGDDGASTPMMAAAGTPGRDDVLRYLLAHGGDANTKASRLGLTPLHACKDASTVQILLDHGGKASVNERDWGQRTPLHGKSAPVAKLLLEAGADPNSQDFEGESPYSKAYEGRDEELKKVLADHGGRMTDAQIARHLAARAQGEIMKRALEHGGRM